MRYDAMPWSNEALRRATWMTRERVDAVLALAAQYREDPERAKRVAAQKCVSCFYTRTIAGQAMTNRPCASCGKDNVHHNTSAPALCIACAKQHCLCAQCGGDIDLNLERTVWPVQVAGKGQD